MKSLSCGHCVNAVSTRIFRSGGILKSLQRAQNYTVHLFSRSIMEFDEKVISLDKIKQTNLKRFRIYKAI